MAGAAKSKLEDHAKAIAPAIFEYEDYRNYLSDWFEWKQSENSRFSGAVFARQAGLQAHSLLGMVIRGKRSLSSESIRGFCRAMKLNSREALFFERLVLFNQAKNDDDRAFYLKQLGELNRTRPAAFLTDLQNYVLYLSDWSIVAIRELIQLKDFEEDPEWIMKKLKKRVSKKQVDVAIEVLQNLKLVKRTSKKKLVVTEPLIDIDIQRVDFALRMYLKRYLALAKEMLDEDPREDRELMSLVLAVKREDLNKIRTRLIEIRKELNREFTATDGEGTDVVAINTQFLVLTDQRKEMS